MQSSELSIVFLGKIAVRKKNAYVLVTAWTNLDKNTNFWKAKSKEEIKICRGKKYTVDTAISASFWKGN